MNATVMEPPATIELQPAARVISAGKLSHRYQQVEVGSRAEAERVEQNLSLVKHIVSRLAMTLPAHVDLQDVYSSGLVGLLQAVRNYDPEAGSSFESYARVRIKGAIFDELRRMDWVPRSIHEKARKVQMVMERLEQTNGRIPTEAEVAKALDLTPSEYEDLLSEIRPATFVCLDSAAGTDDDKEVMTHELVADEVHEAPDFSADRRELANIVAERLERLPEMQRKVLALYYFEDLRLREIAEVLGVTESRICQIHSQAITSIKTFLKHKTILAA